jgi:pyruvate/2-oxoglutarate dehydrogenase complex dihydrolipoamide dehydrogenase (E3) component
MPYDYDMIVIGGGAAGLTAAGMSALLGAKTALIEEHRLGGDCTWTGCIPSKTLLRAAKVNHQTRTADRFGLVNSNPSVDFGKLMDYVRHTRQHVYDDADAPPNMEKLGVIVIAARARFIDPHTLELTGANPQRVSSRYFVIATGSRPNVPNFDVPVLTNETIFELKEQPKRLLILGSGPIGIEMSQAFQRLGSEVTVVSPAKGILSKDDPELTAILQQSLEAEGIRLRLGQKVTQVNQRDSSFIATLEDSSQIACDGILAAMGRVAVVQDFGLDAAGVHVDKHAIRIDSRCRTTAHHIYAAGDVTGKFQFTHMAEHMAKVAVTNAILHLPARLDAKHVTWCTFSEPELAHVGASEEDVKNRSQKYQVYRFPFTKLDRAVTDSETTGLVKVIATSRGRILGVSIVGTNAGEMIGEWALAMKSGLKVKHIADTIHPYPTYILGNRRAADQWYTNQLQSPFIGLLGKLFRYRGVRRKPDF